MKRPPASAGSRTLSASSTTADVWWFNYRVRDGNGWNPPTLAGVPKYRKSRGFLNLTLTDLLP